MSAGGGRQLAAFRFGAGNLPIDWVEGPLPEMEVDERSAGGEDGEFHPVAAEPDGRGGQGGEGGAGEQQADEWETRRFSRRIGHGMTH